MDRWLKTFTFVCKQTSVVFLSTAKSHILTKNENLKWLIIHECTCYRCSPHCLPAPSDDFDINGFFSMYSHTKVHRCTSDQHQIRHKKAINEKLFWSLRPKSSDIAESLQVDATVKTSTSLQSFITNIHSALSTHIWLKQWDVSPKWGFGEQWSVTPAGLTITSAEKNIYLKRSYKRQERSLNKKDDFINNKES